MRMVVVKETVINLIENGKLKIESVVQKLTINDEQFTMKDKTESSVF